MSNGSQIKFYLSEKEKENVQRFSDACGLSMSAFCRLIVSGYAPKRVPNEDFWKLLNELTDIQSMLESGSDTSKKLQEIILRLQAKMTVPERSNIYGNNKPVGY
jgi:hypothetical protein